MSESYIKLKKTRQNEEIVHIPNFGIFKFKYKIKKPKIGVCYDAWAIENIFNKPVTQYIKLLRKYKDIIYPLSNEIFDNSYKNNMENKRIDWCKILEMFYDYNNEGYELEGLSSFIDYMCFDYIELNNFRKQIIIDSIKDSIGKEFGEFHLLGETWMIPSSDTGLQSRITELEAELAACREQLDEARRANTSGNGDTEGFFEAYPICKLIYDLHLAGKNQDEIRSELKNKGYTNAQTGFLTQKDTLRRSDNAVKQSMKRSQKKT